MPRIGRREFLATSAKVGAVMAAVGTGGVVLDGCSGGKVSTGKPPTTLSRQQALKVGVSSAKPKMGGSVAFGTEAEESGVDPTNAHFDSTGVMYARAVYDPLAIILEDGTVAPYLAESIVPSSDYRRWSITVRPDVVFHDGSPCDGQALLFCMREFLSSDLTNFAFTGYMDVGNPPVAVVQTGPRSIVLKMEKPWVPFDYWLAGYIGGQCAYMFSPRQYLKGESVLNLHPVGTGPFKFEQWEVNSHFLLTRNDRYWRKDRFGNSLPYLDSFEFRPIPDVTTRYAALQSTQLQMMHTDYDPTIVDILSNKSLVSIMDNELSVGEPDCTFTMVNLANPVTSDPLIRRALAHATDQRELAATLWKGIASPTNGPFPSPSPYASDTGYPQYSPRTARQLAGEWVRKHGGKQPKLTYTTTDSEESLTDAEFLVAMWAKSGIKVSVSQVPQAELIDNALGGLFQLFSWRQFANVNPDLNYVFWCRAGGPIDFARNFDPTIQHSLDRARQSTSAAVRTDSYETVAARMAVDLPYLWTGRDVWNVAAHRNVENWNNPTAPDGRRGLTMLSGIIWPTEVWVDR